MISSRLVLTAVRSGLGSLGKMDVSISHEQLLGRAALWNGFFFEPLYLLSWGNFLLSILYSVCLNNLNTLLLYLLSY